MNHGTASGERWMKKIEEIFNWITSHVSSAWEQTSELSAIEVVTSLRAAKTNGSHNCSMRNYDEISFASIYQSSGQVTQKKCEAAGTRREIDRENWHWTRIWILNFRFHRSRPINLSICFPLLLLFAASAGAKCCKYMLKQRSTEREESILDFSLNIFLPHQTKRGIAYFLCNQISGIFRCSAHTNSINVDCLWFFCCEKWFPWFFISLALHKYSFNAAVSRWIFLFIYSYL